MKTEALELIPIGELKPFPGNPRRHSRKQRRQLAALIRRYGFTAPIIIDENNVILAGHCRVEAAKLAGLTEIPCRRLTGLTETEKYAYVVADNKIAENASWDEALLEIEMRTIVADVTFEAELTCFDAAEIDLLVETAAPESDGDPRDDALPEVSARAVSRPGDFWILAATGTLRQCA